LKLVSEPRQLSELREKIVARREILFRDLTAVRALENYLMESRSSAGVTGPGAAPSSS
jgi:hypothetical protein